MRVLHKVFPDCMITGQVPPCCLPSPPHSSQGRGAAGGGPGGKRSQPAIATAPKIPHVGSRELKEAFTPQGKTHPRAIFFFFFHGVFFFFFPCILQLFYS